MNTTSIKREFTKRVKAGEKQTHVIKSLSEKANKKRSEIIESVKTSNVYTLKEGKLIGKEEEIKKAVKESKTVIEGFAKIANKYNVAQSTVMSHYYTHCDNRESYESRKANAKSKYKWTEEYTQILKKEVSKSPGNLQNSFRKAQSKINEISETQFTLSYVNYMWYNKLNHNEEIFKIVSKHQTLTNIKNNIPQSKIRGVRKVIRTLKDIFSKLFS